MAGPRWTVNNPHRVTCGITNDQARVPDVEEARRRRLPSPDRNGPSGPGRPLPPARVADCVGRAARVYEDQDFDGRVQSHRSEVGTYIDRGVPSVDDSPSPARSPSRRSGSARGHVGPRRGRPTMASSTSGLPAGVTASDTDDGPAPGWPGKSGSLWIRPDPPSRFADCGGPTGADCTGEDKDPAEAFLLNNVAAGQYTPDGRAPLPGTRHHCAHGHRQER